MDMNNKIRDHDITPNTRRRWGTILFYVHIFFYSVSILYTCVCASEYDPELGSSSVLSCVYAYSVRVKTRPFPDRHVRVKHCRHTHCVLRIRSDWTCSLRVEFRVEMDVSFDQQRQIGSSTPCLPTVLPILPPYLNKTNVDETVRSFPVIRSRWSRRRRETSP